MGMGHAPVRGFMIEATEENLEKLGYDFGSLKNFILNFDFTSKEAEVRAKPEPEDLEDFGSLMEYFGVELINMTLKFYGKTIDTRFMRYDTDNGSRYDDLVDGIYMGFDEDDLYERKLTPVGTRMKEMGSLPEVKLWTNFG
jgi:hypothetical protein